MNSNQLINTFEHTHTQREEIIIITFIDTERKCVELPCVEQSSSHRWRITELTHGLDGRGLLQATWRLAMGGIRPPGQGFGTPVLDTELGPVRIQN